MWQLKQWWYVLTSDDMRLLIEWLKAEPRSGARGQREGDQHHIVDQVGRTTTRLLRRTSLARERPWETWARRKPSIDGRPSCSSTRLGIALFSTLTLVHLLLAESGSEAVQHFVSQTIGPRCESCRSRLVE